jgi:thiamine monophosphate synthase
VVAIGGITAREVADIYRSGAQALCAISAVNATRDPRSTAGQFQPAT